MRQPLCPRRGNVTFCSHLKAGIPNPGVEIKQHKRKREKRISGSGTPLHIFYREERGSIGTRTLFFIPSKICRLTKRS